MISLTCTSCKKVLEIDDAFAGGVCRCRHCGTIQTVPSSLKRGARPGVPVGGVGAKTLYQKSTGPGSAPGSAKNGSGAQAGAAPGTGTQTAGDPAKMRAAAPPVAPPKRKLRPVMLAGLAVLGVIVAAVVIYLVMHSGGGGGGQSTAQPPKGPRFGDVPLDAPSVIYLLDRSDSNKAIFADLKEVTLRSITSLGPDRDFQILFWSNGEESAYPGPEMVKATTSNISNTRRALDTVYAFGQTDIQPSLARAVEEQPAVIVIATANGWDLNDSFVTMVNQIAGGRNIKLHCLTIGAGQSSKPLETIAHTSGGEFREVTEDQLRAYAQ